MRDGKTLSKLKVAELKELAANLNLSFSDKENKSELITIIEKAAHIKLKSLKVGELKDFAGDFEIELGEAKKKDDLVEVIRSALTSESVIVLLDAGQPEINLEEIGEELVEVEKDIEEVVHKLEASSAPDMADIYDIDQKLTDVVKQDMDLTNVASMLDMGRIKFLDRKYVESMTMLMEAGKACQLLYDNYKDVTHAFMILSAEKILEVCRQAELNDEKAADLLIHAKRSFPKGGKKTEEAIHALVELANAVYREEIIYLENRMAHVEPLINAMRVQGVDVFNAERYLHRAREAFLIGELANVNEHLDKAQYTAEESKDVWINEIFNDIPRVESIIKQASDLGADTTDAEKHLDQAKIAFENEDYSLCSELKKLAERKAMESQHSQIRKAAQLEREKLGDADKILTTISPLVREADAYGINTQEINLSISSARNALINNDYVNALTYAREAESQSKPIWTQIRAQRAAILSSGQPLKLCQTCNAPGITVLQNGKAVCVNCGMVYDVRVRGAPTDNKKKKKKSWNPLK
ncbi:MAG: hypothetical protein KAR56_02870 [Thermoplasmata archaeon]|nr:hypothetical protein [Thermoplasmata archaeon]